MNSEFKLITRKRQRKQKEGSLYESRLNFNRKLDKALEEFESSQFCFELLHTIKKCLTSLGLNSLSEIICYGIGNFTDSKTSLHQLAALISISKKFNSSVIVYDPVLTTFETEILKDLSFHVLVVNEEGKRRISEKEATLVFLPHCPKQLTNNFLWANWNISLCKCLLITNSFCKIIQDNTKKVLQESANYIVKIHQKTEEIALEDCYHIENTFNDIALHYFKPENFDSKFFSGTLEQEPKYLEEAELVTNSLYSLNIKDDL